MIYKTDTIAAIATGSGGAIAVIRISGPESLVICSKIFVSVSNTDISIARGYSVHFGTIIDENGSVVDEVLATIFRAPKSYTAEDMVELSCHDSTFIKREILRLIVVHGGRMAEPGEFTIRAFLAGKMDLAQAEAVADTIAATNKASHSVAINQIRGGYSSEFTDIRHRLLHILSLLELELDFGEEDVEFADRKELAELLINTIDKIKALEESFELGNAIKEGIPVSIIGSPNAGKSTLLNKLLKDNRAMVSDIAGTTRDTIEELLTIDGVSFRFIDTAGIRKTLDPLEIMGIERTFDVAAKSRIILILVDASKPVEVVVDEIVTTLNEIDKEGKKVGLVINKSDLIAPQEMADLLLQLNPIISTLDIDRIMEVSGKCNNLEQLVDFLKEYVDFETINAGSSIVTNSRHWESLSQAHSSLAQAQKGLSDGLSGDLVSQDLKEALHYLGLITGEITTDEILGEIFSKFCIGK